ncbi:MAG: hypothetical protein B7Z70_15965 [Acidithiobacillus ferrivorans]|uniref:Uncharacterized protein n=1 Tax=Acidithiobacillus ferrivorans TaxID=160808 RepID=A0A257SF01_9PROT|nr:MAG: hypothetical protein B7Z70_15965 [Acidithiobacillus ferrivorans]
MGGVPLAPAVLGAGSMGITGVEEAPSEVPAPVEGAGRSTQGRKRPLAQDPAPSLGPGPRSWSTMCAASPGPRQILAKSKSRILSIKQQESAVAARVQENEATLSQQMGLTDNINQRLRSQCLGKRRHGYFPHTP